MDIKDLKILEIRKSSTEVPKQNGPDINSTLTLHGGRKDKGGGAPVNITPVMVPNKTEPKTQEGGVSPVPHYSKSYGERHMDMAVQSKGIRRRHNSCESSVSLDIKPNLSDFNFYIYTAGKISIQHVTIFLSKYFSKGAVDLKFSPDVGNNPNNTYIQRKENRFRN